MPCDKKGTVEQRYILGGGEVDVKQKIVKN
jgi:hypothetical protein